jgi:hypothetical protein
MTELSEKHEYKNELLENIDKILLVTTSVEEIILLKNRQVLQWLFGDLSFLSFVDTSNKNKDTIRKEKKTFEDEWGRRTLKIRRPDLKLDKQWTNNMGQHICEEIIILLGKKPFKPLNKNHYQPDSETDEAIWEAKAQTFYTDGTAGEKILGCPFKYAEVPNLYKKPLKILCMGGAERICREQYGFLPGPKTTAEKNEFIEFYKQKNIECIGATDILKQLIGL